MIRIYYLSESAIYPRRNISDKKGPEVPNPRPHGHNLLFNYQSLYQQATALAIAILLDFSSWQPLESIFSPLAGLLNSLIPPPWYRGFKVAFAKIGRKVYLSRVGNALIFLSVSIVVDIYE